MFQSCWPSSGIKSITLKHQIIYINTYISIYTQHWNCDVWLVVIRLNNHTPSNSPQEMTQYCYFYTPVTNRILTSNSSVGGVVPMNISFWKLKLLLQKWSVSLHCLTLLHFGGNRFKCLGKRQFAGICVCCNETSGSIICREILDWLRNNYLLTKGRVPYNGLEIKWVQLYMTGSNFESEWDYSLWSLYFSYICRFISSACFLTGKC